MTSRSGGRLASRPPKFVIQLFCLAPCTPTERSGLGSSAPHRPAPNRGVIALSNKAPCSALRCPAAQLSSAPRRSASSAERSAVLCRALPSRSFVIHTSKTPLTLIFRYWCFILYHDLCGHFVLSKTEHGVFPHSSHQGSRLETRRSKVICPVPSETQSSVGHQLPGV